MSIATPQGVTTIRRHPPPKPAVSNPGKPTRRNEEPRDGQPNKQPMTPAQPKPDQRHRSKWHQKLGTLLSSQETDTHRSGPTSWSTPRPGLPFYFTRRRSHTQPLVGVTLASESRTRLTRLRPLLAMVSGCRSGTGHRAAGPLCPCLPGNEVKHYVAPGPSSNAPQVPRSGVLKPPLTCSFVRHWGLRRARRATNRALRPRSHGASARRRPGPW